VEVDDTGRTTASLFLYRRLGLPREIRRLLDAGKPLALSTEERWRTEMDLLWEEGRWKRELGAWWRHGRRMTGGSERAERIGACLWVQGRLVPAYVWLSRALGRETDEHWRLRLTETLSRVVEHMSRAPDTKLLAPTLARRLTVRLGTPDQSLGIDMFRRTHDVKTSLDDIGHLRPRPPTAAAESSEWFRQVGALNAALSYFHRHLRDSYSPTRPLSELRHDYRWLMRTVAELGAYGGAARVVLLPGSHRVFTAQEVRHALRSVEFARWQRIRLGAHDRLERLRVDRRPIRRTP
jgi:hypothetical protein